MKDSRGKLLLEFIDGFVGVIPGRLHFDGTYLVFTRKQEIHLVVTDSFVFFFVSDDFLLEIASRYTYFDKILQNPSFSNI